MADTDDIRYMSRALQLARRGLYTADPNPRVGCVLVKDGIIVGEGWHERAGEPHAEVHALRTAGGRARGATAYVTLEPCSHQGRTPPCCDGLIEAGVSRVVAAMQDPNPQVAGAGLARLEAAGIATESGVLAAESATLNPGFIQRMRAGRPWVRCKLAMSLDGRTALASGESQWITGPAARADVHRLRARSSAILTGSGTAVADDPSLTARLEGHEDRNSVLQPLRVVLDTQLALSPGAKLLNQPGPTLILTGSADDARRRALETAGAEVIRVPVRGDGKLDLDAVLGLLGEREINEVMVEAGPTLAGALVQAGRVDELVIYMAPLLLGDASRGLFCLPGLATMTDRVELTIEDIRAVGEDWRIRARVK